MMNMTICYKTKTPVIYNEGTRREERRDTFLLAQTYGYDRETLEKEIAKVNETKPAVWDRREIDWDKIDYLFVKVQEEMY